MRLFLRGNSQYGADPLPTWETPRKDGPPIKTIQDYAGRQTHSLSSIWIQFYKAWPSEISYIDSHGAYLDLIHSTVPRYLCQRTQVPRFSGIRTLMYYSEQASTKTGLAENPHNFEECCADYLVSRWFFPYKPMDYTLDPETRRFSSVVTIFSDSTRIILEPVTPT